MSRKKIYYEQKTKNGESVVIFWDKEKYTMREHQELTLMFNGNYYSFDIRDFNRHSIESIAIAYIRNTTFNSKWIEDSNFMSQFINLLLPIIEEFKKDVEKHYSFDGWIGRIFIQPVENFIEWLKK